jgi:chorismate-pyruvate lyase
MFNLTQMATSNLSNEIPCECLSIDWQGRLAVTLKEMPEEVQKNLGHFGYMTAYLEQGRSCQLSVVRFSQTEQKNSLTRELALVDEQQRCHLFARIQVDMDRISVSTLRALRETDIPLGRLLAAESVKPRFNRRRYWRYEKKAVRFKSFQQIESDVWWGRSHELLNKDGQVLAHVDEILL